MVGLLPKKKDDNPFNNTRIRKDKKKREKKKKGLGSTLFRCIYGMTLWFQF